MRSWNSHAYLHESLSKGVAAFHLGCILIKKKTWEVLQAVSQLLFIAMLSHLRLPIKLIDVNLETFFSFSNFTFSPHIPFYSFFFSRSKEKTFHFRSFVSRNFSLLFVDARYVVSNIIRGAEYTRVKDQRSRGSISRKCTTLLLPRRNPIYNRLVITVGWLGAFPVERPRG